MRTKEESAAYMRLRAARAKLSLIRARIELGRDISTGMKIAEVQRLAELKLALEDARYEAVTRTNEPELVDDAFESVIEMICAVSSRDATPEFDGAVADLLREGQAARDAWEQSKEQS